MLGLPIYRLGSSYYLHTRIGGKQIKRSLGTGYKRVAIIRAITLLDGLMRKDPPQKYELDASRGIFKAEGVEDHARLMQAIEALKTLHLGQPPAAAQTVDDPTVLKLGELLEKYLLLRKVTQSTADSYRNVVTELAGFLRNPRITKITTSDITRYQEHIAKNGNGLRTVSNKITTISALFNFAKKHGYTREENPAANRSIMSPRQKAQNGFATFEEDEIVKILGSEFFRERLTKHVDYTSVVMMGLFTGCRVGEITVLKKEHFKSSKKGIPFITIRDSKTTAGIREVPLHPFIYAHIAPMLDALKDPRDKLFRYREREGKGAGNAAGKMFSDNLEAAGVSRDKLVFHSLRKYVNNEMMQNRVNLEHRCQLVGHEINNVNVAVYSKKISIDDLAAAVFPTLDTIAETVRKAIDPMAEIDMGDLIDPDMLM